MTLDEIKASVAFGLRVWWKSNIYRVIKDDIGQWLIKCTINDYCIGLTWVDGVTMNGKPEDFYIE
jgi:hypothetical protein